LRATLSGQNEFRFPSSNTFNFVTSMKPSAPNDPHPHPHSITVRVGCALEYEVDTPTLILLVLKPRPSDQHVLLGEELRFNNGQIAEQTFDAHGNVLYKTVLAPGLNNYRYDAIFRVRDARADILPIEGTPLKELPLEALRYTMASRYCESDKLASFAMEKFGDLRSGAERVQAICDWTHRNIEYRYGAGSSVISACEVIERGYGVCRDFAHVMVALCRALDIPARYVAGHVPFLGVAEGDIGVDFHAYCEVFLGGCWHPWDARYNKVHPGRIKIAHGMDAVDAAFATIYGKAAMTQFQVWSYRVDDPDVKAGDPVGIMKTLDGSAAMSVAA
jgi:transglutaminase-like putative cysteine protease